MSINPVFCNIYLWFNLSTTSFFLCVFVFHSVLLLVNSTLVIFVVPYEYSFCLLVKGINLLGCFPFAMRRQSFPWFALDFSLSFFFPFFPFLLSFTCPLFPSPNSWPLNRTTWIQSENWVGRAQMRETGIHAESEQFVWSYKCSSGIFTQQGSTVVYKEKQINLHNMESVHTRILT